MNPQIRFGEDLMSRVSYAMMNPGGEVEMTRAVREAIDPLAAEIAAEAGIAARDIVEAGLRLQPGDAPPAARHRPGGTRPGAVRARHLREPVALARSTSALADVNAAARVFILPCIAGHVGADAAAVALAEEPDKSDDLVLIVDVGTNAEILLGNRDRVARLLLAHRPGLRGGADSSGQRAAPGAIERVEIDPATKEPRFKVIGCDLWSDEPGFDAATAQTGITGICGSGIIEAVAEMRMAGIVDSKGPDRLGRRRPAPPAARRRARTHRLPACMTAALTGRPRILVTQGDIRAIQLAKSALYAGARLLMDEMGSTRSTASCWRGRSARISRRSTRWCWG